MLRRLCLLEKQIKFAEAHVIQRRPTKVGLEGSPLGPIVLCRMHKTRLVSSCFKPSQTTKDYIRAEGDFRKEISS